MPASKKRRVPITVWAVLLWSIPPGEEDLLGFKLFCTHGGADRYGSRWANKDRATRTYSLRPCRISTN
jgi:hypothetical protein